MSRARRFTCDSAVRGGRFRTLEVGTPCADFGRFPQRFLRPEQCQPASFRGFLRAPRMATSRTGRIFAASSRDAARKRTATWVLISHRIYSSKPNEPNRAAPRNVAAIFRSYAAPLGSPWRKEKIFRAMCVSLGRCGINLRLATAQAAPRQRPDDGAGAGERRGGLPMARAGAGLPLEATIGWHRAGWTAPARGQPLAEHRYFERTRRLVTVTLGVAVPVDPRMIASPRFKPCIGARVYVLAFPSVASLM